MYIEHRLLFEANCLPLHVLLDDYIMIGKRFKQFKLDLVDYNVYIYILKRLKTSKLLNM